MTRTLPEGLNGHCDERFAAVADVIAGHLATKEHQGVGFAAFFRGEPVIDVWGGSRRTVDGMAPWADDTMVMCFSTTKGIAATALHMAMERSQTSYDTPVADVWPEFGNKGKESITIRHLLTHRGGIPQIRDQIDGCEAMGDWEHMVGVMESLEPLWEPGTASVYHAINFGWLIGETLRRIDGRHISTFLAEELAGPLSLDGLFIGTPTSEHGRIAPLIDSSEVTVGADEVYDQIMPKDSIPWKALSPKGSIVDYFNTPAGMSACIPSISGAFTARSLAKVYAAMERRGEVGGTRILSPETVDAATTVQSEDNDGLIPRARWRLGYMSGGELAALGPNREAFGHIGAGGTVAGADPKAEVSFGLVYDQYGSFEFLGGPRTVQTIEATIRAAEAAGA
jgi:CubicO group peptidase (beta-lactamase class C family)